MKRICAGTLFVLATAICHAPRFAEARGSGFQP